MKLSWRVKDAHGNHSSMLTFAVIAFVITSLCVVLSVIESVSIAGHANIQLKAPDATLVLGYLGATFGAYVMRKNKKDQLAHNEAMAKLGKPVTEITTEV